MSPRRSVADAQQTRDTIVATAIGIASLDGLEGVTIGRLAGELAMSKSGVLGHFGTKESLQLAALDAVIETFQTTVVRPALRHSPGVERLLSLCDNWYDYLADTGLPGGCLLTATALEFDGRPGPVHDMVAECWRLWDQVLRTELKQAISLGQLDIDADQALFEIVAFGPAVNQAVQLHHAKDAAARAKRAARRALGL